jgi:hypothetical protein
MAMLGASARQSHHTTETSQHEVVVKSLPKKLEHDGISIDLRIFERRLDTNGYHESSIADTQRVGMRTIFQITGVTLQKGRTKADDAVNGKQAVQNETALTLQMSTANFQPFAV